MERQTCFIIIERRGRLGGTAGESRVLIAIVPAHAEMYDTSFCRRHLEAPKIKSEEEPNLTRFRICRINKLLFFSLQRRKKKKKFLNDVVLLYSAAFASIRIECREPKSKKR
jgi:hypothetical protein